MPPAHNPIVSIILIALAFGFLRFVQTWGKTGTGSYPYRRRTPFLSAAERSFLGVLDQACPDPLRVLVKVRLADLIKPGGNLQGKAFYQALNRINQKHVDFVLADRRSLEPILVVELDDSSHQRADRQQRDAFLDKALAAAGIPVLHVPVRRTYAPAELTRQIQSALANEGAKEK